MNKNDVRQYQGCQVRHGRKFVTITGSRMIEKSGGTNVTMVKVVDEAGDAYEVSSRSLRVA